MTGPVIFADETAREQLTQNREVVTFRTTMRTTGTTWWRATRTGPKMGDCRISCLCANVNPSKQILEPYVELSGFPTVDAWRQAIESLNDGLEDGHLYYVTLI